MLARLVLAPLLLTSLIGCIRPSASAPKADPDPNMVNDQCYAPQVPGGVITDALRREWIKKVAPYGMKAEATYGVPAAAIIAMSSIESGYGHTRLALGAFNPFGYKYTGPTMAEGHGSWTLTCQPKEDDNNVYIKFANYEDAFMFVAKKLATVDQSWVSYKKPTDKYIKDRNNGVAAMTAVDGWIDGISDAGYNYDPKNYSITLKKLVRNGVKSSWDKSPTDNLIQYTENTWPKSAK